MDFNMGSADAQTVLPKECPNAFIRAMQGVDNGVFAMCRDKLWHGWWRHRTTWQAYRHRKAK